jgi:dTDP-4-amino-4,6-dideoxygalactose transaminase
MPAPGLAEWLAAGRAIARGSLLRHEGKGQAAARFERDLAAFTGARHALAVSSGTGGLLAALAAAGVGPGDEVLVPAYTWVATAAAPLLLGAVPVLVDIDESLTIDPADLARKITPASRAVIPVHMVEAPADMDAVRAIARRHGLLVIEDAAQAVGARYGARFCGTIGDAGVFSFNPYKNIDIGEGGAVLTDSDRLFARARMFHDIGAAWRGHGTDHGEPAFVGMNLRVTELAGAMLGVQLRRLGPMLARRAAWRAAMDAALTRGGLTPSPHHSAANALGLTLLFDTEGEAAAFAARRGAQRLLDNSKHVHTNWEPILARRMAHPRFDPWAWAGRRPEDARQTCPRTLDILARTCRVTLGRRHPPWLAPMLARRYLLGPRP